MPKPDVKVAVKMMLKKLPNPAAHQVFDELESSDVKENSNAGQVRQALIEHLNAMRPHRVRRLFTASFEPFMTGDINLYRTSIPIPGLILRTDIAALWHIMSEEAFPDIAQKAVDIVDELCATHIVGKALEMPEAKAQLKIMQKASVDFIDEVLETSGRTDKLLKSLNEARIPEVQSQNNKLTKLIPVNVSQLKLWRDILAQSEALLAIMETFLKKMETTDEDLKAGMIERTQMQLSEHVRQAGLTTNLDYLVPVTLLNVPTDYAAVADFLRMLDMYNEGAIIAEAMVGHFEARFASIIRALADCLESVTRDSHEVYVDRKTRRMLDNTLEDFGELLEAVDICKLNEHPRIKPLFANAWNTLRPNVEPMILIPAASLADLVATERVEENEEVVGFESALWLFDFIWRWNKTAEKSNSIQMEFESWRDDLVDDLEFAFREANRNNEENSEAALLAHLVRINKILNAVGSDITPWVSAGSKNFLRITQRIFNEGLEVSDDARPIIAAFMTNVRGEVRQIMSWKNPELEDLVEQAAAYGF